MKEWITGRNPVLETLRANRRHCFQLLLSQSNTDDERLDEISKFAKTRNTPVKTVHRTRLDSIYEKNQGVALEVSAYPYVSLDEIIEFANHQTDSPLILLLDMIQDPQNLATLLRTAEAMGVHGVVIPASRSVQISPTVVNASSGATEYLKICQFNLAQAIPRLKSADIWVIGLDESLESQNPENVNLNTGIALVVGNEGSGLRHLVRKSCDNVMRIPMMGKVGSLNAAVAGSIALYLARQAKK